MANLNTEKNYIYMCSLNRLKLMHVHITVILNRLKLMHVHIQCMYPKLNCRRIIIKGEASLLSLIPGQTGSFKKLI